VFFVDYVLHTTYCSAR